MGYDIEKIIPIARRRKRPTFNWLIVMLLFLIAAILLVYYQDHFVIFDGDKNPYLYGAYGSIVLLVILTMIIFIQLFKPNNILRKDLKNIYHYKSHKDIVEIPVSEIKTVRTRVKSSKKSKRSYGTVIIRTTEKRYRIKRVYDLEEVEKKILSSIDELKIYLQGMEDASSNSNKTKKEQKRFFRRKKRVK